MRFEDSVWDPLAGTTSAPFPAGKHAQIAVAKVRSRYARQDSDMVVRVVAKDTDGAGWRYELAFSHDTLKNPRPVVVRELVDRQEADGTEQAQHRSASLRCALNAIRAATRA